MIKFSAGFLSGALVVTFALVLSPTAAKQASYGVNATVDAGTEIQRDHCRSRFLSESKCFQNKTAKECDKLLTKQCG